MACGVHGVVGWGFDGADRAWSAAGAGHGGGGASLFGAGVGVGAGDDAVGPDQRRDSYPLVGLVHHELWHVDSHQNRWCGGAHHDGLAAPPGHDPEVGETAAPVPAGGDCRSTGDGGDHGCCGVAGPHSAAPAARAGFEHHGYSAGLQVVCGTHHLECVDDVAFRHHFRHPRHPPRRLLHMGCAPLAPAWRTLAVVPHRLVHVRLRDVAGHHVFRHRHEHARHVFHAHGWPHDSLHGRPGVLGAGRPVHPVARRHQPRSAGPAGSARVA